jgi:hypothetical protein
MQDVSSRKKTDSQNSTTIIQNPRLEFFPYGDFFYEFKSLKMIKQLINNEDDWIKVYF